MTYAQRLDILTENLAVFKERAEISGEQIELTLSQIAALICEESSGEELSGILARYSDALGECTGAQRLTLCREIVARKKGSPELRRLLSIGDSSAALAGTHGKITFPKNKYNDAAFERFSQRINGAKAIYSASINAACEAVADGSCEFCILPVENSLEGKLFSFYALLDRYELKICAACDLEAEEDSHIRYALVCRGYREPSERTVKSAPYLLDLLLLDSGEELLCELLEVARLCKAELISVDTRPVPYDAQSKKLLLSFRLHGNDGLLFCGFLPMNYDGYTPIGLYREP